MIVLASKAGSFSGIIRSMRTGANYTLPVTVLGLGLTLIISFVSYFSASEYFESNSWQIHSEEVIALANKIQMSIERAEAAQHGFILTGNPTVLATYRNSIPLLESDFQELKHLVSDNPTQVAKAKALEKLVQERLARLQTNVDLIQQNKRKVALRNIKEGYGSDLMNRTRELFRDFMEAETTLLHVRTAAAQTHFAFTTRVVFGGHLLAFLLLLVVTVLLYKEVSLRRRAEARAMDASHLKSQFLANMSHEIRTPLNGIIGMTKTLEDTRLEPFQKDCLNTIRDSSNGLLSLINQILDLSKIESGKLQLEETHFELRSLIDSTLSILAPSAHEKGLPLVSSIHVEVPDMYIGDPLRIRQIILNLLNNAIKFSKEGRIEIRVQTLADQDSTTTLLFEVIDQGVGMDQKVQGRLFQSFSQGDASTTRLYGGTGLGLVISRQLIELMGGRIGIESEVGKGSRFFFQIDLKTAKYCIVDTPHKPTDDATALRAHVLIAEDNAINQKVASAMLSQMGCTFEFAGTGQEAIQALAKGEFDLVLMDGQMPTMDGYEATRRIRAGESGAEQSKIPIIAVTANAIKGDVERCLEAGMDDYVSKPIVRQDLRAKIQKWLRSTGRSLDLNVISSLKELESEENPDLVGQLVQIFESTTPDLLKELMNLAEQGQFEELNRRAHHFKSTCMSVGAIRMRNLTHRLERAGPNDDIEMIRKLIEALDQEFAIVKPELKKHVAA